MSKVIDGITIPETQVTLNTRELNICKVLVRELIEDIKSYGVIPDDFDEEWLTEADIPEFEELVSKLSNAFYEAVEAEYDVR